MSVKNISESRRLTLAEVRRWAPTCDVAEAAAALGISRASAYQSISEATFPVATVRVNQRLRVLTSDLLRVLEGGNPRQAGTGAAGPA